MQPTMRPVAQAVQAQGRGKDSMLMHMSPREVGGLQALALAHGGSLTINPETGLPEAGFLEDILPTLLGIGASFLFPMASPWLIGAGIGGIQAARTGDIGKGLMAGLGAFGGAGIGSALGAAGAQQGVQAAGAAGADLTAQTGALAADNARDALLARSAETLPASVQALPTPTGAVPGFGASAAQAGQGVKNLFASGATGEGARAAALGNIGGAGGAAKTAGMIASPLLAPEPYKPPEGEASNYEGPYVPTERTVRYPTEEERRRLGTSEFTYFTPSNPVPGFQPFRAAQGGEVPGYEQGGIAALARGRREGRKGMPPRFLAGGGDGMSDSIPAVIDGKQPARLADGEFVIPADVVSHLGNGSSKAGAKKLYAMMDRVRKARTGKKRQAPEVNMNRMMPA